MTKILIADDHLVVRAGIKIILSKAFDSLQIEEAQDYEETKNKVQKTNFDLLILDINMPGSKNKEMIKELREIDNNLRILIFSGYDSETYAVQYIIAGANGYINKLFSENKIVEAVKSIIETDYYYPPNIVNKIIKASSDKNQFLPLKKLSKRELEIANLLVQGDGNIEISNKLNIQMSTVSTYKNRIFEKLSIKKLVDLIYLLEESKHY